MTLKEMYDGNPGESDFGLSKPEDRVSGGSRQLYWLARSFSPIDGFRTFR